MKKFGIVLLIAVAAYLGYVSGQQQAKRPSAQSEQITEAATVEPTRERGTANTSNLVDTPEQPTTSRAESDEEAEGKRVIEVLIANHPYYTSGVYQEMLLRGGNYLYAIERLVPENGISDWGVTRSNQVKALLEQPELAVLSNVEVECRITVCLIRGEAASESEASLIHRLSGDIQYYGKHSNFRKNQRGTYSFYTALYDSDDGE